MAGENVVFDKYHFRHGPKWSGRLGPAEGGGMLLCVACVIELIQCEDTPVVKKCYALSGVSVVLKSSPGALRMLFQQDCSVSQHFINLLLEMLQSGDDPDTVEKVNQVLVQLLLELQSEPSFRLVLDKIHKQVSNQLNLKQLVPTFNFLGNLLKVAPNVAHCLVTQYVNLLDQLCSSLVYPDENQKASIIYVWFQMLCASSSAAKLLPTTIRDRVCILLLQTLAKACSPHLIGNCLSLLWQLVQMRGAVSVLMNCPDSLTSKDGSQEILTDSQTIEQNQEQQPRDHCPLPLILKKLLLSSDEILQVTSSKCIACILAHSPSQYSTPFIEADIPGFLFDCLAGGSRDVLLWSVYRCLLLMAEDQLFFSQCHSVYGIESLVRSLKESLRQANLEVPKQGLLLLTVILKRQPPSVRLFPSGPGFVAVTEAMIAAVSSSCLLVATLAVSASGALLSLPHQSIPVQYKAVKEVIKAISNRLPELVLLQLSCQRTSHRRRKSELSAQSLKAGGFLLQALICFEAACRLAEACASDPVLRENNFTKPYKKSNPEDSLESLRSCLLHLCDSVWIPTVIRMSECSPNAKILQYFYSILTLQFTLLPALMPAFTNKLASSGFYRLAMEHKAVLCAGNRNAELNTSCCGFLQKLSVCILSHSDPPSDSHQNDVEEVENLLRYNLPSFCSHLSDWPSLLCNYQELKATQFCALILLYLSLQRGYRLLPEKTVFTSVVWMLHSKQDDNSSLPHSVLRSALYLLAVTQDKSPSLEGASLNCISKTLASCHGFSSLYFHHPALLHFIFRYPVLAKNFGRLVLELWLTRMPHHAPKSKEGVKNREELKEGAGSKRQHFQQHDVDNSELVNLAKTYPAALFNLLDIVCTKTTPFADRALGVLEALLKSQRGFDTDVCGDLRLALLQALQWVCVDNMSLQGHVSHALRSLPLVLKLLCLTQANDPPSSSSYSNMEGVHFKLLYHVSNIAGKLNPTNTESLLPAFNYLYCCLSQSPAHCTDRAVSMLLGSRGLIGQLQSIVSSRPSSSIAPSLSPLASSPSDLLSCCHLLLSSLIILQRVHLSQVQNSISWSLDTVVHLLLVQKRRTDDVLLLSYLRVLRALLDTDMTSEVVSLSTSPDLVGPRPLGVEDGALHPLGSRGALYLLTALSDLILQKHELLLRSAVMCLSSLLGFLWRKSPTTAHSVLAQPWNRFLLHCLLTSSGRSLLHPAILWFITLPLQDSSATLLKESDLLQVIEAADKTGLGELTQEAAEALRLLLTQVESRALITTPGLQQRARNLMEALRSWTPAESSSQTQSDNILQVGNVFICQSDFKMTRA